MVVRAFCRHILVPYITREFPFSWKDKGCKVTKQKPNFLLLYLYHIHEQVPNIHIIYLYLLFSFPHIFLFLLDIINIKFMTDAKVFVWLLYISIKFNLWYTCINTLIINSTQDIICKYTVPDRATVVCHVQRIFAVQTPKCVYVFVE